MGKSKKEKTTTTATEVEAEEGNDADTTTKQEFSYEEKLEHVNAIAKPMASKKLTKKCYKLMKKASQHKNYLMNGLRLVQKRLQKGDTGIVLFAGNVTPIDIICHLPGVCESKNVPYCYTPSRGDMGNAIGMKRGLLTVLIKKHDDYKELFDECITEITTLPTPL